MKKQFRLWHRPFVELCNRVNQVRVQDFIRMPAPDHIVKADDRMDQAFRLFVVGRHGSLLVKDRQEIVGLIRFSDVYQEIKKVLKEGALPG